MDRQEFIDKLYQALADEISPQQIQSNLAYYEEYISTEISRGRTEAEVLEELGDPRLIARTIMDAQAAEEEANGYYREETGWSGGYEEAAQAQSAFREEAAYSDAQDAYYEKTDEEYEEEKGLKGFFHRHFDSHRVPWRQPDGTIIISGWKGTVIIALIVIAILLLLSTLFTIAFRILLSPAFWCILMIWMLWRTLTGGGGRNGGRWW